MNYEIHFFGWKIAYLMFKLAYQTFYLVVFDLLFCNLTTYKNKGVYS